jgi:hypothetical protein
MRLKRRYQLHADGRLPQLVVECGMKLDHDVALITKEPRFAGDYDLTLVVATAPNFDGRCLRGCGTSRWVRCVCGASEQAVEQLAERVRRHVGS